MDTSPPEMDTSRPDTSLISTGSIFNYEVLFEGSPVLRYILSPVDSRFANSLTTVEDPEPEGSCSIQVAAPDITLSHFYDIAAIESTDKAEDEADIGLKPTRKKPANLGSCRHCSCKRTSCLSLHCKCFAALEYCGQKCWCSNCRNKSCNEDLVVVAREKIRARKALPGCTCKKSGCTKKYCECYSLSVGCSSSCRCLGCKNPFGHTN